MKQYYKNGNEVSRPNKVRVFGRIHINPDDRLIKLAGYVIKESDEDKVELNNNIIKVQRENAYKQFADKYLIAYQAYKELGDTKKALEMKELWLKEREIIDKRYPYIEEKEVKS